MAVILPPPYETGGSPELFVPAGQLAAVTCWGCRLVHLKPSAWGMSWLPVVQSWEAWHGSAVPLGPLALAPPTCLQAGDILVIPGICSGLWKSWRVREWHQ